MLAECEVNDHIGMRRAGDDHGDLLSFLTRMNLSDQMDEVKMRKIWQI